MPLAAALVTLHSPITPTLSGHVRSLTPAVGAAAAGLELRRVPRQPAGGPGWLNQDMGMQDRQWLQALATLARAAGDEVMAVYATDFEVQGKPDASPVTEADVRAEAVILAGLRALASDIPVVAEEAVAAGHAPSLPQGGGRFWLVDPLDGTREFVNRNGEFTVNIALIDQGLPVMGVVWAPAIGRMFAGAGQVAWTADAQGERSIRCRKTPPEGLTVLASRSHGDEAALSAYLASRRVARLDTAGSSLKLCLLAAGEADLYPRLGRTMEWDIAAGHAVLAAAGGRVDTLAGLPLVYGKAGFENPHFVAMGLGD